MKYLKWSILTIILLTTIVSYSQDKSNAFRNLGSEMPEFVIEDREGIQYTNNDISEDVHSFIVLFNPGCGHCTDVAKIFQKNKSLLIDNTVFFVATPDTYPMFAEFIKETGWEDNSNMKITIDKSQLIEKLYRGITVPQINVYDAFFKLIKSTGGEGFTIDDIKEFIAPAPSEN